MYCVTNQFPDLQCLGPHNKLHGVCGLGNNYHIIFDPKLGHVTCAIRCINCDFTVCTSILVKSWVHGIPLKQQPCYQPVKYCTYWPVLGSFNNWNIIQLSHKASSSEEIDKIHQVLIDGISDNRYELLQPGKYDAINTIYTTIMGCYAIKYLSESYTLQEEKRAMEK